MEGVSENSFLAIATVTLLWLWLLPSGIVVLMHKIQSYICSMLHVGKETQATVFTADTQRCTWYV